MRFMEKKLSELREEYKRGQQHLEILERQRQETRDTMLRISGAILVLEELVQQAGKLRDDGTPLNDRQGVTAEPATLNGT